jgi:single-stranded DNA-binding protein
VNVCHLLGKVITDPKLETATNGRKICRFRLSTSNGKDKLPTKHNIVVWGKNSSDPHPENVCAYAQRGARVQVTGKIYESKWQPKNSTEWRTRTEVIASSIEFITKSDSTEVKTDALSE